MSFGGASRLAPIRDSAGPFSLIGSDLEDLRA
jgi:hypothetical protein